MRHIYQDSHGYSQFDTAVHLINRGLSVLSWELERQIILASQKHDGETGKRRVRKQRRPMDVAERITAARHGPGAYIIPHGREARRRASRSTCIYQVPCHTRLDLRMVSVWNVDSPE
jgi:hypothetical protein